MKKDITKVLCLQSVSLNYQKTIISNNPHNSSNSAFLPSQILSMIEEKDTTNLFCLSETPISNNSREICNYFFPPNPNANHE